MTPKSNKLKSSSKIIHRPTGSLVPGIYTQHRPSQCKQFLNGRPIHLQPTSATEGKKKVKILINDSVREKLIPSKEPQYIPAIWHNNELTRIKNQAHVLSLKDRQELIDESERQKNILIAESEQRKLHLRRLQQEQRNNQGTKLTEVEAIAKERREHLLRRAVELKQEQEDEVKKATRLILSTKCHAIRDAQVAEKALIKRELGEEDKRLQHMIRLQTKKALAEDQKQREIERQKNLRYVGEVLQQIKENELRKLFDLEKKEEEARILNKAMVQMQLDEIEALRQKKERQEKIRNELNKANHDIMHFQKIEQEEERIAELKVLEFMRKKAEREAAFEETLRQQKIAKEKEIARLRAMQERENDLQAQTDELNAQRIQEEVEKKWRQQEKQAAKNKMTAIAKLKADRQQQIMDQRRMQALEIAREEREFNNVIQVQKKLYQREQDEDAQRGAAAKEHRKNILKQVNEREKERIEQRKNMFEEGLALRVESNLHDKTISDVIKRKVLELRENKVPEVYVKDIARQLNVNITPAE